MGSKVVSMLALLLVATLHRNSGAEMSIIQSSTSKLPLLLHCLFRIIIQIMLRKFTNRMLHSSSSPSMALRSQRRTSRDHTVNLLLCLSHNSSGKLVQDINLSPLSIIVVVAVVVVAVAVAVVVLTPL